MSEMPYNFLLFFVVFYHIEASIYLVKTKSGEEGNKSETYIRNEGSKEVVWGNQFTLRPRDHWWNSGTKTRMQRKTRKTRTRKITRTKRRRTKHTSRQREITRNRNTQSHTCTCGKNNFIHNGEISGGEIATPNEFPWVVRIYGGCSGGVCGGTLISPKVVASAFHCAVSKQGRVPCDHSDGRRKVIIGRHEVRFRRDKLRSYRTISIIDVKYPARAGLHSHRDSHDFALFILERPVQYSANVQSICLPRQNAEYGGVEAWAAGWGRTGPPRVSTKQSPYLKKVKLTVSKKKYYMSKMFGTLLSKKDSIYQDPCSGDSGGPLMHFDTARNAWVLIGTVQGNGYDCRTGTTSLYEGSDNGLWNKVSTHVNWIKSTLRKLQEPYCS